MGNRPKGEADPFWSLVLQEMKVELEDTGRFTRVILSPSVDRHRLQITAELWENYGREGSRRVCLYAVDYPHPYAKYLSAACWQACLELAKMEAERQSPLGERLLAARSAKMRNR